MCPRRHPGYPVSTILLVCCRDILPHCDCTPTKLVGTAGTWVAYLKQAIQDLPANIFLIRREQLRVQELVDVSRKVVFGQQVFHFTKHRVSLSSSLAPITSSSTAKSSSEQPASPSLSRTMKLTRTFVSRRKVYESPQDVVDVLVGIVFGRDDRVEF